MKKLLLITNIVIFCFSLIACKSSTKTVTSNDSKTKPSDAPTQTDNTKTATQTTNTGSADNGIGVKKDSTIKNTTVKAINHSAPNQAQIDSLKNVKTKNKKK